MIIFHHNDADGRCAAAIVLQWAKTQNHSESEISVFEMDYKTPLPVLDFRNKTVVIVDFSFKPEDMAKIQAKAKETIWCDHHATAKDYGYDVPGKRDFSNKGLSGCELTYQYFFFPVLPSALHYIPDFVNLIGDYDTWRLRRQPQCFQFYEGLKLYDQSPSGDLWKGLFNGELSTGKIIAEGEAAIKYRNNYCAEMRKAFGYETEIGGHKAFATNIQHFGSPGFGDLMKQYPLCIAYAHDGKKFTVSLYSEKVDVSVIAKENGGGGHFGAAGFICEVLPFKPIETYQ